MIFTSLSSLNRWGTPESANTTVTNYRAVKRRASHRAYTTLTQARNSRTQVDSDAHSDADSDTIRVTHLGIEYSYKEEDSLHYYFAKATTDEEEDENLGNVANENETSVEARYVAMLPLSDSHWRTNTGGVATYEGVRYEQTSEIQQRFFRETLAILIFDIDGSVVGSIRASSIYEDAGTTSTTTVTSASFPVQCAEGIFYGVKLIHIFYDNDTYSDKVVRTLRLYY